MILKEERYATLVIFGIMALAVGAFIGIVLLLPDRAWSMSPELEKVQQQMLSPVVQLNRSCTAFLYKSKRDDKTGEVKTLLLTARHCVTDSPDRIMTIYVPVYQHNRIVKEDGYRATVLGQYYKGDVALLQLTDKQTFFANIVKLAAGDVDLNEGEDTWVVGYPLALTRTMTRGMFSGREYLELLTAGKDDEYFRSTPQVAPGNSGGPLFHQNAAGDYEVIGLVTASVHSSDFINFETPINVIQDYLKIADPPDVKPVTAAGH